MKATLDHSLEAHDPRPKDDNNKIEISYLQPISLLSCNRIYSWPPIIHRFFLSFLKDLVYSKDELPKHNIPGI